MGKKPPEPYSRTNKIVRSGSVSNTSSGISPVLRASTSAYPDSVTNVVAAASSESTSSSSSVGIVSPPPDLAPDK